MKNTLVLIVVIASLLNACGGIESDAKKAVINRLKDPDSAKFGKLTQIDENNACLSVNARNSMGGYTGYQQASLKKESGQWIVVDIEDISHGLCVDLVKSSLEYLRKTHSTPYNP